jgi:hypothetical protein
MGLACPDMMAFQNGHALDPLQLQVDGGRKSCHATTNQDYIRGVSHRSFMFTDEKHIPRADSLRSSQETGRLQWQSGL